MLSCPDYVFIITMSGQCFNNIWTTFLLSVLCLNYVWLDYVLFLSGQSLHNVLKLLAWCLSNVFIITGEFVRKICFKKCVKFVLKNAWTNMFNYVWTVFLVNHDFLYTSTIR